jgi:hypothetical protein
MPDAFFTPTDDPDTFRATELTAGPWTAGVQHGGPPAALLTRVIEALPSTIAGPTQLARITFELLGPVPVDVLHSHAEVVRPGRSVELIEAHLVAGGRPVMRARAWRLRRVPTELPAGIPEACIPPAIPGHPTATDTPPWDCGYATSVEWRFVSGDFDKLGPSQVWTRLRIPVIADEEPSGLQRAVAVADSGNGLSRLLDFDWWFINTELTVHAWRQPAGEWIFVAANTTLGPDGAGLAETELSDSTGTFGRGTQALLVALRP